MNKKTRTHFFLIALFILAFVGCKKEVKVETDLSNIHLEFFNQDSVKVTYPDFVKGQPSFLAFIFTHCPDICPMITNNLQRIQRKLNEEGISDVKFVSVTFDPDRDFPSVLKEFASVREINFDRFSFLTAEKKTVDSLRHQLKYLAIAGDTTYGEDKKPSYFFVHTDRIYLLDKNGNVVGNYKGSEVDLEKILTDVKTLIKDM
ncbi:MAG: SCO family protein [Ignavibacteriales bacterium]|nr:MAG: SCO family protein [Ignavibacteriales bacterium]